MQSTSLQDHISYLIIDTRNYVLAQNALRISQNLFPLRNSFVFSDLKDGWDTSHFIHIDPINSVQRYCEFLLRHAWKFVTTEFFIVLQYDGFVLDGDCFCENFLNYDYVGAPWAHFDFHKVGNGGFSLRSKRLMMEVEPLVVGETFSLNEDILICRKYRRQLERAAKIKFAPPSEAKKFSREHLLSNHPVFGFHGYSMLPLVYNKNIDSLFQHLPPTSSIQKYFEIRNGCDAIGVDEISHGGFREWCFESRKFQNIQKDLSIGRSDELEVQEHLF